VAAAIAAAVATYPTSSLGASVSAPCQIKDVLWVWLIRERGRSGTQTQKSPDKIRAQKSPGQSPGGIPTGRNYSAISKPSDFR
jgi:hypothetical protein